MTQSDPDLQNRLASFVADSVRPPTGQRTHRAVRQPVHLRGKATAVIGMRRSGKTTYLHQLRAERLQDGVKPQHLPYWNFEDERLRDIEQADLTKLFHEYLRQQPDAQQRGTMLCLDEVQLVPGWERFVRRLLDTEPFDVFISGSSAAMLSREVATSMRGRGWEVVVHPFSFDEALRHAGVEVNPGKWTTRQRASVDSHLVSYLTSGGFPEVQGLDAPTRLRVLRDYVDVVILRDIVERHSITSTTALRWLVRHLLPNAGASFSVQKFFDALKSQGLRIGKDTLHDLLAHLTDCFLVRTVWLETDSERRRMVNPRKVYPVDPGLIALFDRSGKANIGHALENAVLIELERRGAETSYVRTKSGHEVDFLARMPDGKSELIQVTMSASDADTATRELRALVEAAAETPNATLHLVVLDPDGLPRSAPENVAVHTAAEWLLGRR